MNRPADYDHLLQHTMRLFPGAHIDIHHTENEIIHIDVDWHRFTFEIGSDDDAYIFDDGVTAFIIPIMETPDIDWDFS